MGGKPYKAGKFALSLWSEHLGLHAGEHLAAWICFYDRKDLFKEFLERVIRLKQGRELTISEKTNNLVFMINAFQVSKWGLVLVAYKEKESIIAWSNTIFIQAAQVKQ
ncbi:hypothetical protein ACFE04_023013 [Oxalis oulophora]